MDMNLFFENSSSNVIEKKSKPCSYNESLFFPKIIFYTDLVLKAKEKEENYFILKIKH